MAWAFGDRGSVRVEVPTGFRVEIVGADMEPEKDSKGLQAWKATTARPLDWYAWITATNDEALTRDRLALAGGDEVVIRGWPEDKRWRSRVRELLRDGVPALVDRIGLAWPVDGSLVISEVHTPLLEGYAGFYDPETDEITISEDLDDLTIIHEASHAWFNKSLFTERWITEGLADEYAALVLQELDRGYPDPPASSPTEEAAFPLSDWPPPAAIRDEESLDRESYGYAASWALMRSIVTLVGEDAMRAAFAAAVAGTTAYPGEAPPERSRLPNDWRRFLDLVQGGGKAADEAEVADMVAEIALDEADRKVLPARASARRAFADLVEAGGEWAAPVVVRMAMDRWQFDDAMKLMNRASDVLAVRDEISGLAGVEGLEPPAKPEEDYQDAGSVAELTVVKEDADRSLAVLEQVAGASDVVEAPRDWFTEVGLDGADPATDLAAARTAWERGGPRRCRGRGGRGGRADPGGSGGGPDESPDGWRRGGAGPPGPRRRGGVPGASPEQHGAPVTGGCHGVVRHRNSAGPVRAVRYTPAGGTPGRASRQAAIRRRRSGPIVTVHAAPERGRA